MISAGRVLLMPKGAYNPSTTYEMLDIVSYNGSSYIAKGTTTGNLPTDTTYWQLSAYGGQAANVAGNFAELEISSVASMTHYADDIFVDENSQLMKATQTINIGDTIDVNTNCTPTTVEALITSLSDRVDSLDSTNRKLQGAIEIAAQTDLHSLALGEYYKSQTSFYVTNAPVGINQVTSAKFRLTVEAALDNASQASSPLLLTLRTPDGKIFTQGYNGSAWSTWEQSAAKSEIQTLANQADDIVDVLSAKNLWSETIPPTANVGGSYTLANHEYVVSTTASANSGVYWSTDKLLPFYADKVGVSAKLSFEVKADAAMRAYAGFYNNEVNLTTNYQKIEQDIADLSQIASAFKVYNLDTTSAHTISMKNVMIRPANITSDAFVPYAMTNRELTENYKIKTAVVSVPATYHGGSVANINFEKRNGVVRAYWAGGTPTFPAQGTEYEIGDIPAGFIPSQVQTGYGVDMNSFTKGMYLQLRTNGKIYIYGYNTGTNGTVNALVSLVYLA